ncbi:MBOAT family protein [Methylomicrobium sp. Wu6]|uniref:MBOAT family O-acyltransferase n=1 Tax=Methylomicrobium sp. Wu6 TaxID=3107928 RepID=UPI002DD6A62C|nr:MBOAT family protein [Methylomicrobium sp. Wu6]MEC4750294.1 MBOAT family protein [Methylomicrobium sp. Wu6]
MLFNSYVFIFAYLPIVFFGYFSLGRYSHKLAAAWLALASIFFYGWWDARFTALLLGSIAVNYSAGYAIAQRLFIRPKLLLILAVSFNLLLLGYFKYFNFFIDNLNQLAGAGFENTPILLPLGISFFTFTQIAFLVDSYQGKAHEYNLIHYTLFVTYFPHLIAGPVLHHKEMMPQFAESSSGKIDAGNVAIGTSIFIIALAKKILLADSLAEFATPIFAAVHAGGHPMLIEAWIAALSYTLQLYFDFSAYSEMAIGLSLMFNVRLPINFDSPYKSTSIIEFWRRWHMTLSRFLRDYLYIPLGGNRKGTIRRHANLIATMLLGGLWHGAGWPFVIWGGLHGCYLMINHVWLEFKKRRGWTKGGKIAQFLAGLLTFTAVVVGWVFFRAETLHDAIDMLRGMAGMNGCALSRKLADSTMESLLRPLDIHFIGTLPLTELDSGNAFKIVLPSLLIIFYLPNLQQSFAAYRPALPITDAPAEQEKLPPSGRLASICRWRPMPAHAWGLGLLFVYTLLHFTKVSEFLYFRF